MNVAGCKGVKVCPKRHLKSCKTYQTRTLTQSQETKELDNKVEVLETLFIEMAKKMVKIETELQDVKTVLSKSEEKKVLNVRKSEYIKEKQQDQYETDPNVKDQETNKTGGNIDELFAKKDKDIHKVLKPQFNCKTCGARLSMKSKLAKCAM